jgi:hypothetical protein
MPEGPVHVSADAAPQKRVPPADYAFLAIPLFFFAGRRFVADRARLLSQMAEGA